MSDASKRPDPEVARIGTVTVTSQRAGDRVTVSLAGDLDAAWAEDVQARLLDARPPEGGTLVIDLSGLRYLDSGGLRALFEIKHAFGRHGTVLMHSPSGHVARVLEITGLHRLLITDEDGPGTA
jgi:anti-sigma B factor antagonist